MRVKPANSEHQPIRKAVLRSAVTDQQDRLPQELNLQSPFAADEVQQSCQQRQPQDLDALHVRKRARHVTPEPDSLFHSKLQQLAKHYKQTAIPSLSQSDPITIHRPTAQRPTAGTACSFGLQAFPSPPVSGLHAFSAAAAAAAPLCNPSQPASCAFVPDSLATAAALANVMPINKPQAAVAGRQLQQEVVQPESSADNRILQRESHELSLPSVSYLRRPEACFLLQLLGTM